MIWRRTVNLYLVREYALSVLAFIVGIGVVISLFDAIELLRRSAKVDMLDPGLVAYLTMLKIPGNFLVVLPFATLFAAMALIMQLNRRQEIVVLRMAGGSLWQILFPLFLGAAAFGGIAVMAINPLSAATRAAYQRHEEMFLKKESHMAALFNQGLWLRQQDHEGNYALLHAERVNFPNWMLTDVSTVFFSPDHEFLKRIDSQAAFLDNGFWNFDAGVETPANGPPRLVNGYRMATGLTQKDIEESFLDPETISFWSMPTFIRMLKTTGFPVARLQVHYGALWGLPLLLAAMVMIAAVICIRPHRGGGQVVTVMGGVFAGFLVFFLTNFIHALGESQQIPVFAAAFAPAILAFAAGVAGLMTLEDG